MIQSSSKMIGDKKYSIITFHHQTQSLSIFIIDKSSDIILSSEVAKDDLPVLLFKIFGKQLKQLYQYLISDDSTFRIYDFQEQIRLQYTFQVIKKKKNIKEFILPTKRYLQSNLVINQHQFQKQMSKTNEISAIYDLEIVDCQTNFCTYNNAQLLKEIKVLENHPNWYFNQIQNICIQLSDKLSTYKINKQLNRITYKLCVYLNQFHQTQHPRYDLTIGFATQQKIAEMRVAVQPNFTNTISTTIDNRSVTSQFINWNQQKRFNRPISPKKLQLIVTINKSYSTIIEGLKIIMSDQLESILVNILNQSNLSQIKQKFIKFDDYVPFIYLYRSFLHFSFGRDSKL